MVLPGGAAAQASSFLFPDRSRKAYRDRRRALYNRPTGGCPHCRTEDATIRSGPAGRLSPGGEDPPATRPGPGAVSDRHERRGSTRCAPTPRTRADPPGRPPSRPRARLPLRPSWPRARPPTRLGFRPASRFRSRPPSGFRSQPPSVLRSRPPMHLRSQPPSVPRSRPLIPRRARPQSGLRSRPPSCPPARRSAGGRSIAGRPTPERCRSDIPPPTCLRRSATSPGGSRGRSPGPEP